MSASVSVILVVLSVFRTPDALGSVVALADVNGEIRERYTYSPYGKTHVYFFGDSESEHPLSRPVDPASNQFYHDHDLNSIID